LRVVAYTYYSAPWKLSSGDDSRIHFISRALEHNLSEHGGIIVYNLSLLPVGEYTVTVKDHVVYVSMPRYLYRALARILKWEKHYDLNPLAKLTHYVDESITALKLRNIAKSSITLYVFGSMSLLSVFMRLLKWKGTIIYDPLANYAQTLYLRSRRSMGEVLRYGLYLALHRLQLKCSNYVVYPSKLDLENAERMFKVRNTGIIPNPVPLCFESYEEYEKLRALRRGDERPYFILLAGGRNRTNKEAVKLTIEVFNKLPEEAFQLHISGPWQDLRKLVKNNSIKIHGVVSTEKLKELLAISDYGLSPVFSHVAGTYLKTLTYVATGLHLVTSPWGLQGIEPSMLKGRQVFIVRSAEEYANTIRRIVFSNTKLDNRGRRNPSIVLCGDEVGVGNLKELWKVLHSGKRDAVL